MKRFIILTLLIMFTLTGSNLFAANEPVNIYLGGYLLLRIRVGSYELTKAERAKIIKERAAALVSAVPKKAVVRIVKRPLDNAIFVNNVLFITVGKEDAAANYTTIDKQTKQWVDNIRKILPKAAPSMRSVM